MWSSCYRAKAAAVSRADHPSHGDQDVGSSIAAAFTRPHYSSSTPSGTLGDATTRWPAAYPPIAAVSGGADDGSVGPGTDSSAWDERPFIRSPTRDIVKPAQAYPTRGRSVNLFLPSTSRMPFRALRLPCRRYLHSAAEIKLVSDPSSGCSGYLESQ